MKKTIASIILLVGTTYLVPVQAQLLRKIQNAAAQGVENAATKKTREATERATTNAIEGVFDGLMKPAPTEAAYSFTGYSIMEVKSADKKGKAEDPVQIHYLLSSNTDFMGMSFKDPKQSTASTTTIMDTKNQAMVILMEEEGQKSSMSIKLDYDKWQQMGDDVDEEEEFEKTDYKITKTGNSKSILGYNCEEYLVTSEDGEGRYWVTEKPIDGFSMFSPQSNPMMSSKSLDRYKSMFSNAPTGTFMETVYTDTEGRVTEMKVVEIKTNSPQNFQMSDYPNMMAGKNN
jgi:GTP cyclohydrolase II